MTARIIATELLHKGWTTLLKATIRLPDGAEFPREIENHGNAVGVLPYDPVRRTAVLVRLLRAPVLHSGEAGELVEAPAGMMDEDDPEQTARREAEEEVGLKLSNLEHVVTAWSSPGVSTERIALYLAPYRQGDRVGRGGGVAGENENITVLELPLAEIWEMISRGELTDLKTVTLVLALRHRHPELFEPA